MAGFFGLFDYSKEGPGVDKNAPKKKGFVVFFEIYFRKFWKLICANLLYVLFTIPILTIGMAQTGLTYITRNFVREKHAFIYGDFVDTIKKNWKQALGYGILNVIFTLIVIFDIFAYYNSTAQFKDFSGWSVMNYLALALMFTVYIVFTFMKYYIPIMIITFKLRMKQILKNAAILAFAGLKRNLLISFFLLLCYAFAAALIIFTGYIGLTIVLLLYIFLFPALRSMIIQHNVFPVVKKFIIDPYYKEHPNEDLEAKRALNLEDEYGTPETTPEDEPVFQDMGRTVKEEPEEEKPKGRVLPKQYSEQELRKGRRLYKKGTQPDDDDDTI
nr:MAG TPA: protein of unknown function DUF624 [Inoviridae sp.]